MRIVILSLAALAVAQQAEARTARYDARTNAPYMVAVPSAPQAGPDQVPMLMEPAAAPRRGRVVKRMQQPVTDGQQQGFEQSGITGAQQVPRTRQRVGGGAELDAMIARHAAANGLPLSLVHRVVIRESRYNPRAYNRGAIGLMQIKHATARGVGYSGSAAGLYDAETNLTYAVRYLAGAYRVAGGNENRAVSLYASGYYYVAKRAGFAEPRVAAAQPARSNAGAEAYASAAAAPAPVSGFDPKGIH